MGDTAPYLSPLAGCICPSRHKAHRENSLWFENSRVATDTLTGLEEFKSSRGVGTSLGHPLMSLILRQNGETGQPLVLPVVFQEVLQRMNSEAKSSLLLGFFLLLIFLCYKSLYIKVRVYTHYNDKGYHLREEIRQ